MYCIFKVKGRNKTALIIVAILLVAAIAISILGPKPEESSDAATAEVLVQGLRRGDLDWRNIVNPKRK